MTTYSTERVLPSDVEPHVLELWKATRSKPVELERMFRWYYLPPDRDNACFVLRHSVGETPRLVGATGLGTRSFVVEGHPVEARLLGDFFVDKAHRSLFPALSLQRTAADFARARAAFVYGFPNDKALPVFQRLGFAELGTVARYVRVLDYRPYLSRRFGPGALVSTAAHALNGIAGMARTYSRVRDRGYSVAWETRFDQRFDELDRSQALGATVRGQRDAQFLNWRFIDKPGAPPHIATLVRDRDGALCAYAVFDIDDKVAHVRDLFGTTWRDVERLLGKLEGELARRGATSISFNVLGAPALCKLLERLGFATRPSQRKVIVSAGVRCGIGPSLVSNAAGWYLTDADEDQ